MIVGILSDTHGHVGRTEAALRVLESLGAEALVHCGDIGGLEVLEALRRELLRGVRIWAVCGNTDFGDPVLVKYGQLQGMEVAPVGPLRLELCGRALAVFHGHESAFARLTGYAEREDTLPPEFGRCDYLLHGHTHVAADHYVGPLRVINPGALQRAITYTVATLDVTADEVHFWEVSDTPGSPLTEYTPMRARWFR